MSGAFGYWVFRALSGLASVLPEPLMRRLGYGVGYLLSYFTPRRRHMAERHMRRVMGPGADHRKASRQVFGFYGRYYAETFWMRPRRRRFVIDSAELENLEILKQAIAAPRGIVLAVGHMGNWEVAGLKAASEGAPVLAVAEALINERIVEWFVRMRMVMDIEVLIPRRGTRVTIELMRRLEEGGVVALVCDRDLKGNGIPVTLFGEQTTLPPGPISLACRSGATVLPVGCYFRPGPGHHFVIHPPLEIPDGEVLEERVAEGTRRLATALEEIIRRAPQQWHVVVPNWPSDREAG